MARTPETPWPHGQKTMRCLSCHGSGLSRDGALEYTASRKDYDDPLLRQYLVCRLCDGRGRVLVSAAQRRPDDELAEVQTTIIDD